MSSKQNDPLLPSALPVDPAQEKRQFSPAVKVAGIAFGLVSVLGVARYMTHDSAGTGTGTGVEQQQTNADVLDENFETLMDAELYKEILSHPASKQWTPVAFNDSPENKLYWDYSSWKGKTMVNRINDSSKNQPIEGKYASQIPVLDRLSELSPHEQLKAVHDLPENFDSRNKWYYCNTIGHVRDQASCGCCWAFGTRSTMADRACIGSEGKLQHIVSADDLMTCCKYCTEEDTQGPKTAGPCLGGNSADAFYYWKHTGVVSGDNYGTGIGCKPYTIAPGVLDSPWNNKTKSRKEFGTDKPPLPECTAECKNKMYLNHPKSDRVYASHVYSLPDHNIASMMYEIYHHGPVTGTMNVYKDFSLYKEGVYRHTVQEISGGHSIEVIGWGTDEKTGVNYWMCKNSWNKEWALSGFFKIERGINECDLETGMLAGVLDTDRYPKLPSPLYKKGHS